MICDRLGGRLDAALAEVGGLGEVLACPIKPVADAVQRLIITDRRSIPRLVLHCAPTGPGNLVARAVDCGRVARSCLGDDVGSPVLLPTFDEHSDELSIAVYPFCASLRERRLSWIRQRRTVVPRIYAWLREAVSTSLDSPADGELRELFTGPLERLAVDTRFTPRIREAAADGLARLATGHWEPKVALSHNDFWKGNVLLPMKQMRQANRFGIVVIDWPGSSHRGHPFYDLLRMSHSTRVSWSSLTPELEEHCRIIGCDPEDVPAYLAAHIGWLSDHRNHFPEDRFVAVSEVCFDELLPALNGATGRACLRSRQPIASARRVASAGL